MAKWGLSSWLVFVRLIQVLGTIISAALNGALLVYMHVNGLGQNQNMFSIELMTGIVLVYTAIVLLFQHTGNQRLRMKTGVAVAFIVGDVIFTGIVIGIISMLARAGVPANCGGFQTDQTNQASTHDDDGKPEGLSDIYTTKGFSNQSGGAKGELDKFCALERGFYFISVAIIFTYMTTISLALLRIFRANYTRNSEVDRQLARQEEMYRLEVKMTRNNNVAYLPIDQIHHDHPNINDNHNRRPTIAVSPLSTSSPAVAFDPARKVLLIHQQQAVDQAASDRAAEEALVTDGYRQHPVYGVPPPFYTPGSSSHRFMDGHGNETNEMRLSDYVKGETRAQSMKDNGGGL